MPHKSFWFYLRITVLAFYEAVPKVALRRASFKWPALSDGMRPLRAMLKSKKI
jgi:hypothetical protein